MKMLFAAIALGSIAIPASADEVLFEVQYADLNLETSEGQKALERRIDKAARKACGGDVMTGTRVMTPSTKACVKELKAAATKQFASMTTEVQKGG